MIKGGIKTVAEIFVKDASKEAAEIAAKQVGEAATRTGENLVYRSLNAAGDVNYVGITADIERRAAEQLAEKGIRIAEIPGLESLSRADARAVEQVLIEFYGLEKNGGTLVNKINSIAQNNEIYAKSLRRGAVLLRRAGYVGF